MKGKTGKSKISEYNAKGSEAETEAMEDKADFNKGGAAKKKKEMDGGHAKGRMPKKRLDRKPRASGGRSPYSSAESVSGGASEDEEGKREVTGPGAETELSVYRKGGKVKK